MRLLQLRVTISMEINSKIHLEQPAPRCVQQQRSDKRDEQTDRQTDKKLNVFDRPRGR